MRRILGIFTAIFLVFFTISPVFGQELIDEDDLKGAIPEKFREYFSENGDEVFSFDYIEDFDGKFFIGYIIKSAGKYLSEFIIFFTDILLLILISCIGESFSSGLAPSLSGVVSYIPSLCCGFTVFSRLLEVFDSLGEGLYGISSFLGVMSPIMSGIFLSSGNINTSGVAAAETLLVMNVINYLTSGVLMPTLRVCFSLECIAIISKRKELSAITAFTKNTFVYLTSALMLILTTVFTYQTAVASGADSWILRGTKFAAGSIPVVGGAISEASKTIFGSFEVIKSISGGLGIVVILLTAIPPFVELVLIKTAFSMGSAISGGMGSQEVASVLKSASELMGFALAMMGILTVGAIFTMTLLIIMGGSL